MPAKRLTVLLQFLRVFWLWTISLLPVVTEWKEKLSCMNCTQHGTEIQPKNKGAERKLNLNTITVSNSFLLIWFKVCIFRCPWKSILTYLDANDFLSAFAVEANTSVINVNDLIFGNVRETKTEENDIIVSSSNNKQYSVPVLSDCKTETKTGWKRRLSYSAFLALQTQHSTFQFLQVVLMESHVAVFLSLCFCLLILSLLCPYPVSQCQYHYLPACVPSTPEGWAQRLWQREVWVDEITC